MTDTTYMGRSNPRECEYEVSCCNGGTVIPLDPCFSMVNHSPDGLSWGYGGSGPAQLAFALLYDATKNEHVARTWYKLYKAEVVSKLPPNWQMPIGAVSNWVLLKQQEQAMGPRRDPLQPIFRDHDCWKCRDGELPCTGRSDGDYGRCEYPHARND